MSNRSQNDDDIDACVDAWDKYDPDWGLNDDYIQELHTIGDDGVFDYDDIHATFIDGFFEGVDYARGIKK